MLTKREKAEAINKLITLSDSALIDYKERPASIHDILTGDEYFGKLTGGGKMVYPIWEDELTGIHREELKYLIVLTGAIGTGKTRAAVWGIAAGMQRILCMKDPWTYFGLAAGGKMAIVFFNLTTALSMSRSFGVLQSHLLASSWFTSRGFVKGNPPNQRVEFPLFEYKIASPLAKGFGTLGEDVILAIMDEVDSPTETENSRKKVLKAYENTVRRFESRFVDPVTKESLGKFFLVASKQEELSFLNTFIAEKKASPSVYVVDISFWDARPEKIFSGKKFAVMIGSVYVKSRILTSAQERQSTIEEGFEVINVPIEFLEAFETDIDGALRDIAGISVASSRRSKFFPSPMLLERCYDKEKQNPLSQTTVEIGLDDDIDLMNFIDLSKLRMPKSTPRYLHNDVAYSGDGDAMSLAMSGVKAWKKTNIEMPDGTFEVRRSPIIETDFVLRLKGHPGDKIPLFRVRKFILDLMLSGVNIVKYSADLSLLSEDTKQILERRGLECTYISLDRNIKPYLAFLDVVTDQRWVCHKDEMLHFELINLEHNRDKGKIDHPDKVAEIVFLDDGGTKEVVMMGSKDMADGVAGSVYALLEDTGTLPVDEELMGRVLKIITKKKEEEQQPLWWLKKDAAFSKNAEQYALRDENGKYWHWIRETPEATPRLGGPYDRNPTQLNAVDVDDPRAFIPGQPSKLKRVSDDKHSKFLGVLKGVSDKHR